MEERRLLASGMVSEAAAPVALVARIGRQFDRNGDGFVQGEAARVVGTAEPGAVVRLDRGADGTFEQATRADAAGRYAFPVSLATGANPFQVRARAGSGEVATAEVSATRGDAVIAWNNTLLNAIRADATGPPQAARAMAMVQLAVYDAVNAVVGTREPYQFEGEASPGTSASAAASKAAYRVLANLYPRQVAALDAALKESLAAVPTGRGRRMGVRLGDAVGTAMVASRADDGSAAKVAYAPGSDPGDWVPTPPRYLPGLAPQWPGVTPFVLSDGAQFRPAPPPALTGAEYAAAYDEVKSLGSAASTTRTADQTALSHFWSDVPGATFTPPDHWNQIAQEASMREGYGLARNARLFAVLDAALADAAICCWDAKYHYDLWRPVTAIRRGDQDGNPDTAADLAWTPLWVTPNFSSYTSGHSTFSGSAQVVLESFFGDDYAFTDPGDPTLGLAPRSFRSFEQAAEEAGLSRVLGGIHFRFDNETGLQGGRVVGQYVVDRLAR